MTNLRKLKKKLDPMGFMGLAFSNVSDPWHLVVPGRHQLPSGEVVRIVEDLLNTFMKPLL